MSSVCDVQEKKSCSSKSGHKSTLNTAVLLAASAVIMVIATEPVNQCLLLVLPALPTLPHHGPGITVLLVLNQH